MTNGLLLGTGAIVGMVLGGILLIVAICIVAWWVKTRNAFVRLKNKAEEAWATIDVYLKKRFDLIPNLVETVKGFAKHESETLKGVIAARNIGMTAATPGSTPHTCPRTSRTRMWKARRPPSST